VWPLRLEGPLGLRYPNPVSRFWLRVLEVFGREGRFVVIEGNEEKGPDLKSIEKGVAWSDLMLGKVYNPFKWVEFVVALSLDLAMFVIGTVMLVCNLPAVFLVKLENWIEGESKSRPIILRAFESLFKLPVGLLRLVVDVVIIDVGIFLLNCIFSPVNTVIAPVFRFFREVGYSIKKEQGAQPLRESAGKVGLWGVSILFILVPLLCFVVLLVMVSGGASLPVGVATFFQAHVWVSSIISLLTPAVGAVVSAIGSATTGTILFAAVSLIGLGICHRIASLEVWNTIKLRLAEFGEFVIPAISKAKENIMDQYKQAVDDKAKVGSPKRKSLVGTSTDVELFDIDIKVMASIVVQEDVLKNARVEVIKAQEEMP